MLGRGWRNKMHNDLPCPVDCIVWPPPVATLSYNDVLDVAAATFCPSVSVALEAVRGKVEEPAIGMSGMM